MAKAISSLRNGLIFITAVTFLFLIAFMAGKPGNVGVTGMVTLTNGKSYQVGTTFYTISGDGSTISTGTIGLQGSNTAVLIKEEQNTLQNPNIQSQLKSAQTDANKVLSPSGSSADSGSSSSSSSAETTAITLNGNSIDSGAALYLNFVSHDATGKLTVKEFSLANLFPASGSKIIVNGKQYAWDGKNVLDDNNNRLSNTDINTLIINPVITQFQQLNSGQSVTYSLDSSTNSILPSNPQTITVQQFVSEVAENPEVTDTDFGAMFAQFSPSAQREIQGALQNDAANLMETAASRVTYLDDNPPSVTSPAPVTNPPSPQSNNPLNAYPLGNNGLVQVPYASHMIMTDVSMDPKYHVITGTINGKQYKLSDDPKSKDGLIVWQVNPDGSTTQYKGDDLETIQTELTATRVYYTDQYIQQQQQIVDTYNQQHPSAPIGSTPQSSASTTGSSSSAPSSGSSSGVTDLGNGFSIQPSQKATDGRDLTVYGANINGVDYTGVKGTNGNVQWTSNGQISDDTLTQLNIGLTAQLQAQTAPAATPAAATANPPPATKGTVTEDQAKAAQSRIDTASSNNNARNIEMEQKAAQQAAYTGANMLMDYVLQNFAYPAVTDICKKEWTSSTPSAPPQETRSSDPAQDILNQQNSAAQCSYPIMSAQLSRSASTYSVSYTILYCSASSYSVDLKSASLSPYTLTNGGVLAGQTYSDSFKVNVAGDYNQVCITMKVDGSVNCFPIS